MADISQTIKAKSDQLNAGDLIGGGVTVTVKSVDVRGGDQPVSIHLQEDYQAFKPCLSMRRVLAFCWGKESDGWIGKKLTLFCDPHVTWAGREEGGIRISHMEGLSKVTPVTVRKNKRSVMVYEIMPVEELIKEVKERDFPVITAEQMAVLYPLSTADQNGTTVWTKTASDVMKENNIDNLDQLLASKFEHVKKQLTANNV